MIKLLKLLEDIKEIEFKTPEDFEAYKKKHKMRPGTVVKVAGKDKKVGDDEPKSKKPKSDEPKSDEPKSDTSQDSGTNSRIQDKVEANKIARRTNRSKLVFNKSPERYAEQLEQTLLDIQDHAGRMHDENLADEFYSESEELAMQVNDIANSGEGMSYDDFKQARLFINHYQNTLTGSKQSSPTASLGYRTGKNRGGGMYDNVNPKSSTPLKELSKVTTRYTNRLDENVDMKTHKKKIDKLMKGDEWGNEVYDYIGIEMGEGREDGFKKMGSIGKNLKRHLDTAAGYEQGLPYEMSEKDYLGIKKRVQKDLNRYFR